MSREAKQQYQQARSSSQSGTTKKNRNNFLLPLILLLLLAGFVGIFRYFTKKEQRGIIEPIVAIEPGTAPDPGTPGEDGPTSAVPEETPPSSKTISSTSGKEPKTPRGTNDGAAPPRGNTAGDTKPVSEPNIVSTVEVPPASKENVFVPPVLPQIALETKINEVNNLFNKGGRTSAEKTINEILNAMAPDAKIYYRKPGGRSIPLPQSLRSYLNEVAFLYDNTKVSIEDFQYDPRTGKIIGFTINDPY